MYSAQWPSKGNLPVRRGSLSADDQEAVAATQNGDDSGTRCFLAVMRRLAKREPDLQAPPLKRCSGVQSLICHSPYFQILAACSRCTEQYHLVRPRLAGVHRAGRATLLGAFHLIRATLLNSKRCKRFTL
jgi:hypothetical protein